MRTSPTLVRQRRLCPSTASAALMKGWISSIFMRGLSCVGAVRNAIRSNRRHCDIVSHYVLHDFVEHIGFDWLLYEMARSALQGGDDVFLVAHRRHHDDAGVAMFLQDFFGGFNAFHLRHGDVH